MPTKLVVRTDANWTGQDSEDQKCFSCVVVGFGEHVIDVVCSKQDVVLECTRVRILRDEFCGAQGIHTKNIIRDLHVDVSVRLETDSTSVYGMCRYRGIGRLRHPHKIQQRLQDHVAAKNVELGRVRREKNEADQGAKYLARHRIKKCVTKMGMLFAGAWAGEQLLVVSGTALIFGEDLIEGQSWTMGVVLLVKVGVGLLCYARAVFDPHLPTGNVHVTREPAIAKQWSMSSRAMQDDDLDHLNVTNRDVDSLTVFWKSVGAADDVEHAELVREVGTVLAARCQHE